MGGVGTPKARVFEFFQKIFKIFKSFSGVFKIIRKFLEASTVAPYHLNH
jgi:hypothetical protein|nr:MAG TPA: hypothetical protein [Caudoviricetes sp.]